MELKEIEVRLAIAPAYICLYPGSQAVRKFTKPTKNQSENQQTLDKNNNKA